jgi:hypothetical protein
MGLESHDGNIYLYKKVRRGGRPTSEYVARGKTAVALDRAARMIREARASARAATRDVIAADLERERLIEAYFQAVEEACRAALESAGYHRHARGAWRRRRRGKVGG